jgi:hypothetical protein
MRIFIHFVDKNKIYRINIPTDISVNNLIRKIRQLAYRKDISIDINNIRIRHINKYIHRSNQLNLKDNNSLYISSHKLKGGGEDGTVGLPVIFMSPPVWAVFVSICVMSFLCPAVYIMLLYGGAYKPEDIHNMVYDTGSMSFYNNYYIRKYLDDAAYIDIINEKYYITKYLTDCKFTLFKSKLYMYYYILYAVFVVFTSNLFFITMFMSTYKDSQYKCFVHTNVHPLHAIGISICIVVPIILLLLGIVGYKLSIFTYMLTLAVGCVCILTSVYWNRTQKYDDAIKYRDTDPTLPNNTPGDYIKHHDDFLKMPNYFRYLYYIPLVVIGIIVICRLLHIHPLIWGVLVSFMGSLPAYYILQNELPLYCNNSFRFSKSFEQVKDTINSQLGSYKNLVSADTPTGQRQSYYNIFK